MQGYYIELSKYGILIMIMLYTVSCFAAYLIRDRRERGWVYALQSIFMLFMQFLCFLDLTFVSGEAEYLFFFLFIQIFIFGAIMLISVIYDYSNRQLLNNMCMLIGIGMCMISRLSFKKAVKQYAIVLISFAICLIIPYLIYKVRFFKKLTWAYAAIGIGMLSIVLITGEVTHGSKISFSISGITFQPSEFVKIIYLFFLAAALWEKYDLLQVGLSAIVAGMHVVILVFSKDLGSALIFFITYVLVVVLATHNYWYLLIGALGGCGASYFAYTLFDHVRNRVTAWLDPWSVIDNKGYQITQSLFAITSGSWFGLGLLKGDPSSIPFVDQDFIFSAICEEFGVLFGVCVLFICVSSFVEMLLVATRIGDRFYQIIVYGVAVTYLFQIFLTVGGGIKMIPLTGVTLPFISYGGSSVMTSMFMFFIVQGIHIRLIEVEETTRKKKEANRNRARRIQAGLEDGTNS